MTLAAASARVETRCTAASRESIVARGVSELTALVAAADAEGGDGGYLSAPVFDIHVTPPVTAAKKRAPLPRRSRIEINDHHGPRCK